MKGPDPTLVTLCALTLLVLIALAERFDPPPAADCRIGYVHDGDTVELICGENRSRARLVGLDAPELSDPRCESERRAAEAARQALRRMIRAAGEVTISRRGTDKYRRDLIRLSLDGEDVAARMIREGHARAYDGGARAGWCD
ncbi:thermonuclease family protein [Pseudogemmobacter humi]|uniref:TNase-like domain-containing protein n=1 Tax=Pseudogemmobacter humi TaxID=2483812 RepID=A0A3P5XAY9_9RHOB|nr:thermonuclease family protein [Pseudogemmobacter humi]VDC31714.1 hypothetical protein XINFAN_03086 [Pseudogemmobacter humi]